MKTETVIDADKDIRIISINKKRFVVGLKWRTVKSSRNVMKEIKQIGQREKLDIVAVRESDSIQAGFAPKTKLKLRGSYSLIVSLATLLEGCCIAVIPVGEKNGKTEYTLLGRTDKGGIHPISDKIYSEDSIEQEVIDLKSVLRGNKTDLEISVFGEVDKFIWVTDKLSLDEILNPKNLSKDFKLKPLTWGMTKKQIILLIMFMICVAVTLSAISSHYDAIEKKKQMQLILEQQAQEEVNKAARYKAALEKMAHPWIRKNSAQFDIDQCNAMLHKVNLSIEGFVPTVINCETGNLSVAYSRMANSAAKIKDFVDAVRKMFDVPVDFNFQSTSVSTFSLPLDKKPNGDDPMLDMSSQLLKMISLFQGVNVDASFGKVDVKVVKANEFNEPLPPQDWQEYTFEFNSDVPPRLIFKNADLTGVRISGIIVNINNETGALKYNVKGEIYGKL